MNIEDFSPNKLFVNMKELPYPIMLLIFESEQDSTNFFYKYIKDSNLKINVEKTPRDSYIFRLIFPKRNNYALGIEGPTSENRTYEKIFTGTISLSCGFISSDKKVISLIESIVLDNKISLN